MVAGTGVKDAASIEVGHVPIANPDKIDEVAIWIQERIDKTDGERVKRLSSI